MNQEPPAAPPRVQVLVPPRPNLGPEPWSEPRADRLPLEAAILATVALLLAAWIIRRRVLLRRRPGATTACVDAPSDDPASRLVVLAARARETLAERFGPALRARTTEEIAADSGLREALGGPRVDALIRLLTTADRLKFAESPRDEAEESSWEDPSQWESWLKVLPDDRTSTAN